MCLESGPAIPNSIPSSGRKHPDRMSSSGDSGVLILTRFVVGVFRVFVGGVSIFRGVDNDNSMMVMRGGLDLHSSIGFLVGVASSLLRTTS